jgi:hypothetical protein
LTPCYELDIDTRRIILALLSKAAELDLGNVSFSYYRDSVDFYLVEYKTSWQLVVSQERTRRDVYSIVDGEIVYRYSEKD